MCYARKVVYDIMPRFVRLDYCRHVPSKCRGSRNAVITKSAHGGGGLGGACPPLWVGGARGGPAQLNFNLKLSSTLT